MTWTHFYDMHSGGGRKEQWENIYIEAPLQEAKVIFYNRFGHVPDRVSCTCCGSDYSTNEGNDLDQLTGFERGCRSLKKEKYDGDWDFKYVEEDYTNPPKGYSLTEGYKEYQTPNDYMKSEDALFIKQSDIKPEERKGILPKQGYIYVG